MTQPMTKDESRRLHQDWWEKCRTCGHWAGSDARRMAPGTCANPASQLHLQQTWTAGHCPKWDSFDLETAYQLMAEQSCANNASTPAP